MSNAVKQVLHEIQSALAAFGKESAAKKRAEWLAPYVVALRFDLLAIIAKQDWQGLLHLASRVRTESEHDLDGMSHQRQQLLEASDGINSIRTEVNAAWHPVDTSVEWPELRSKFIAELVASGIEEHRAADAVDDFGRATGNDLLKNAEKPIVGWAHDLTTYAEARFAALAAADLSECVAQFNRHCANPSEHHVDATSANARLLGVLKELHQALRTSDHKHLETLARNIDGSAHETLEPLLRAAAYRAHTIAVTKDSERGREGLEIADAIRLALFVRSAARTIAWRTAWGEHSDLLVSWREAARQRPFRSLFRAPPRVDLDRFSAGHPGPGERVTVEGWLGPVTITHHGRKALSSSTIMDRAGNTLGVGLPFIKLDSGGIVADVYVRFSGKYYAQHHDFNGPVFVPARRSLTHDSHNSWFDWLALQLMPVVTPIAHNLCAQWSWAAGSDGAGNPLRYGTWRSTRKGLL